MKALVHNTGVVFNALASRDHQLEGSIVNGERTFHAAAEASQAFAAAFRALPDVRAQLDGRAQRNRPVSPRSPTPTSRNSSPTERQLSALLQAAKPFAPQFNSFLTALGPLTKAAKKGLPDVKKALDLTVPVLENFRPVLHNLDPVPAVPRRVRARGAGVLRQHHRRLAGERRQRQRRSKRRHPRSTC